jgi:hypothetical protein
MGLKSLRIVGGSYRVFDPQERGLLGRIGMVAKTRGQGNFLRTEDAIFEADKTI